MFRVDAHKPAHFCDGMTRRDFLHAGSLPLLGLGLPMLHALEAKGATKQRCLWASTSTKDPNLPDTYYCEALIGEKTVNTMPLETLEAFRDHGKVAPTLDQDFAGAHEVFERVEQAGVDLEDVWATLEKEGVDKFAKSFETLLESVREKRSELVGA